MPESVEMVTLTKRKTPPRKRPVSFQTVAEMVRQLGDVPLKRIRMNPPPGRAKVADVEKTRNKHRILCELVDGTLVEKAMGYEESVLALFLGGKLTDFVMSRKLGLVSGEAGMMEIRENLVRIPDLAFVSWDRIPKRNRSLKATPRISPNLAIEILSKSNTSGEMDRKRSDYFSTGTQEVWQIDPKKRTVSVYRSIEEFETIKEPDILTGGELLPGFEISLNVLFAALDRPD